VKDLQGYANNELNLQVKKIEQRPKATIKKAEYVINNTPFCINRSRHKKSKLLKRSFSPIIERNENLNMSDCASLN